MTSNCAGAVQPALGFKVSGVGFFGGAEVSKIPHDAIRLNDGAPLPMIPISPKKPRSCSLLRGPLILDVLSIGDGAKVVDPVIGTNTVDVVDMISREFAVHVQPSKAVKEVAFKGNFHAPVSVSINGPDRGINRDAVAGFNPPRKYTSLGVVMKNFTQACCGKIGRSHDAVLSLIGQMPGGIPLPAGHRHFTTGVA